MLLNFLIICRYCTVYLSKCLPYPFSYSRFLALCKKIIPIFFKDCSDFQAGSEIRSKGRYEALDETAVCGLSCKHGIPMKFLNLKGGER